jgi:carboxypeptidase Q
MPPIRFLLSLTCLFATATAGAFADADLRVAEALRQSALQSEAAFARVESLVAAAPYRMAGSAADRKAIDWALAELRAAGLQNVRAEPVTVKRWQRGALSVRLLGEKPQELVATALGGSVATPPDGITAPVLMVDSLDALFALPLADIKGKIVFFNRRMERRADGGGYGPAVTVRSRGAAEAGRRGALGVVIRSIGTNADRVPHTGGLRYDPIAPKIPAAALSAVDADLLEQRLREGGDVRLHVQLEARELAPGRSANVIGEIPGRERPEEIVLLAAHLDSWDITPGANDDAAGVAIVIEAARQILAAGLRPRRTIRVWLAANEEFGLSGARRYARAHAAGLARHALALEADFGSGAVRVLNAGVDARDWPQVLAMAQVLAPLGVVPGSNGRNGGADLGPLRQRGVPVLEPRQDGTHYFDVHHTAADTPERVDRAGLRQNVAVYSVLAWLAAQGEFPARLPVTSGDEE